MKSNQLLFIVCALSLLIVPSMQFGTVFTDYLSTPVNFTDITETYIKGINSLTAYANSASVVTIDSNNPDGFIVNSPGALSATAGQTIQFTSAQGVSLGGATTVSSSISAGGSLSIQGATTNINVGDLTLSTLNSLSFQSLGPLLIQGDNIDITTQGIGNVTARDITIDSATFTDLSANGNLLLNSTYSSSFDTLNGDVLFDVIQATTFESNFINFAATDGVYVLSAGPVNIDAFAVLEIQAAQFAQISSLTSITLNVLNGNFDISAAAAAAIASDESLDLTAQNNIDIISIGDGNSIIQFNSRTGQFILNAATAITIGTFLNTYDVNFVATGGISSLSGYTDFVATDAITSVALNDINVDVQADFTFNALDFVAQSYGDADLFANLGVLFTTVENIVAQALDLTINTSNNVVITSKELTFAQAAPTVLSRTAPDTFQFSTTSLTVSSNSAQFDTLGQFILSATTDLVFNALTVDVRSSAGSHNVVFQAQGPLDITAADSIILTSSNVQLILSANYYAQASTLHLNTGLGGDLTVQGSTLNITAPSATFTSSGDTLIQSPGGTTTFLTTNSFVQSAYNIDFESYGSFYVSAGDSITIGSSEFINFESVGASNLFSLENTFIQARQTGSIFADTVTATVPNVNFLASDTLYFTANLPTDSLDLQLNLFQANGNTVLQSGHDLVIDASQSASFTGTSLLLEGYDSLELNAVDISILAGSAIDINSNGALDISSGAFTYTAEGIAAVYSDLPDNSEYNLHSFGPFSVTDPAQFYESGSFINSYATDTTISSSTSTYVEATNQINIHAANQILGTTTHHYYADTSYSSYQSYNNTFRGQNTNFTTTVANVDAPNNIFDSQLDLSLTVSNNAWYVGPSLTLNGNTFNFEASDQGYFYSQDQITFNVVNDINIQSNQLNFVLPLDGTLFIDGGNTLIGGNAGEPFTFFSYGSTELFSAGGFDYNTNAFAVFDSLDTLELSAPQLTLTTHQQNSDITVFAHEGVVEFKDTDFSLISSTTSFLATRDINIEGYVLFESQLSSIVDGIPVNWVDHIFANEFVAIWAHSASNFGNIVFDSLSGPILTQAGVDIFVNTLGKQTVQASYGYQSTSTVDTSFLVNGNWALSTSTGSTFSAAVDFSLNSVGQDYIESLQSILFQTSLTSPSTGTIFEIDANSLLVATAQGGAYRLISDSALTSNTNSFQSYVVTNLAFTQSSASTYTSTVGDIVTTTSAGEIQYHFSNSFTATANTNVTFVSGYNALFNAGTSVYQAGTDIDIISIDGYIAIDTQNDVTHTAGGIISIEADGARTIPRDGVYLGAKQFEASATGASSIIYLYAKRSVTFGEFTRPTVQFFGGGSSTQNGFTLTSNGDVSTTAGGATTFTATNQFLLTSAQATYFTAAGPLTLSTTGAVVPSNVLIQSLIGNVHLRSEHDSTWITQNEILATSTTGFVLFTTLNTATFLADGNFLETANSLTSSFDDSYLSTSTVTNFDGHTYVAINTDVGSGGTIRFTGSTNSFTSGSNFKIYSAGDNAKIEFDAFNVLSITVPKTGDITFDSYAGFATSSTDLTETAGRSLTITSNSDTGADSSKGYVEFYSVGPQTLVANDNIDISAAVNTSLYAGDLTVSSTGDFISNSDLDQQWFIGTDSQTFTTAFTVTGDIFFENSAATGGSISFNTAGYYDRVIFHSTNGPVTQNIGEDLLGQVVDGFRIATSGSDFKDAFGIRFQTDGPGDLVLDASASTVVTASRNIKFDATADLDIYATTGVSIISGGVNLAGEGVLFVASMGDVNFQAAQSPISIVASNVDIVGNGTAAGEGAVYLIANGIDKGSEFGIRMQTDSGVAAFGSIYGNISVTAAESIDFGLNFQAAHALFGWQRNVYNYLFGEPFPYNSFQPYVPGYQVHLPLQSRTAVIATGVDADIVFDTQVTQNGIGQFVAYAGTIEEVGLGMTASPSQLQFVAYGNGLHEGDFTLRSQGGLSFRGYEFFNYYYVLPPPVQSNILFLANDDASDIVIKTTKEAISSDINFLTPELTIGAEGKLQIRSVSRDGDSNVLFDSAGKITVTTYRDGYGVGSELPGIELRSYLSQIRIDAGDNGDIAHHALRDMYVQADAGFEFYSGGSIVFQAANVDFTSSDGPISYNYNSVFVTSFGNVIYSTYVGNTENYQVPENLGEDVTFDFSFMEFEGGNLNFVSYGGDITFNFDTAYLEPTNTHVRGYMSLPMTNNVIAPGQFCSSPGVGNGDNFASVFIARSPPNVAYYYKNYHLIPQKASYGVGYHFNYINGGVRPYDPDIFDTEGLRICTCSPFDEEFRCMSLDQFAINFTPNAEFAY